MLLLVPGSPKLLAWEVVSFCLLMYVAVAVPFQMAFVRRVRWDLTQWASYWETGVDGFFIADILRNAEAGACTTTIFTACHLLARSGTVPANRLAGACAS